MRSKSPELMSEIKKYIEDYYLQNRQSPSTTKIAEAVGIARGTAYKYLVEMAEKNMIEYDGQEIRTNVTRKRHRCIHCSVHLQAGERQSHGAACHDRRNAPCIRRPHHRSYSVLRLCPSGPQGKEP